MLLEYIARNFVILILIVILILTSDWIPKAPCSKTSGRISSVQVIKQKKVLLKATNTEWPLLACIRYAKFGKLNQSFSSGSDTTGAFFYFAEMRPIIRRQPCVL